MKTMLPLLLAMTMSASAAAQGLGGVPSAGSPAVSAGAPGSGAAGVSYFGMPSSFRPHPYLSPYEYASQQHVNQQGLWFQDTVSHFEPRGRPYRYRVQVEWLSSRTRRTSDQVGDPNAPTLATDEMGQFVSPQVITYRMFFPPLMSQIPQVTTDGLKVTASIDSREGWTASFFGFWNGEKSEQFSAREDRERFRGDEVDSLVLGLTGGIGNPGPVFNNHRDTSDLEIALGLLLMDGTSFDALDLDALDFAIRGNATDIFDRTLLSPLSLPLDDPTLLGRGTYQRFDIDFSIRQSVQTWAAGGQLETAPIEERHGITFRGLIGGRYMQVNEGFFFRGIDSGLVYSISDDPQAVDRVDNDGDFFVDDIEEAGGGGDYESFNLSNELLIRAFVNSLVQSDLAGPELGVSYDLGKRAGISLVGSTRVGAMINRERVRLAGDNIGSFAATQDNDSDGDEFAIDPVTGNQILRALFDTSTSNGQLTQNAFTDARNTTHVSPLFEQSFTARIPLFGHVPVLRDMPVLENATFQAGYTFLWIGEVAEPQSSIVWQSNPRAGIFPTLNVRRDSFYQHTFRLGIDCTY